ncbi:MAG: (Fe-S)-binding protein, partial [Gammaproteobacteria bacterium]|nr:(Fe-S)-binding protein [Gammaproteobacteria bacterium]
LMDNSKTLLRQHGKQSLVLKTLLYLVSHPKRYKLLNSLLRNQKLGDILRFFRLLDKNTADLQKSIQSTSKNHSFKAFYPAIGKVQGTIGLFTGCITKLFDQTTLDDSILLLTNCGYNVHISKQQVCCGAMHQHNGFIDTASSLGKQNQLIFQTDKVDAVISSSTGCTAQLQSQLKEIPVFDLMQFINEYDLLSQLDFKPIKSKLLVHEPCSQRYQLKLTSIRSTLNSIPDLNIADLDGNQFCCGAGGSNLLNPTQTSRLLRQLKVDAIESQSAEILVSTNYGCALHIASGLCTNPLRQNKQIEICHPVSLLVRSASLK